MLSQEGALVRRGDVIARIADLRTFRVDATVSDVHAGRSRPGMPVVIRVNEKTRSTARSARFSRRSRTASSASPSRSPTSRTRLLRPNLRVDVLVVTDRRPRALRLRKGPFSAT